MFFATRYTILPEQLQLLSNKNPGLNWICNKNKTKKEQDWLQGILKAEIQNIDVILSDINLPDIDGYEVAHRLRSSKKTALAQVPIIAITANALKGDANRVLEAGCDMYMPRPINVQDLSDKVSVFVNKPEEINHDA